MNAVRFLALLFLLASFPGLLNAQEEPEIQAGERVRFQYRLPGTGRPTAAQGVFLAKDSMFFSFQGQESTDTLSVPLAQIIEVEVLRGVTTAAGRGALLGGVIGAISGYSIQKSLCGSKEDRGEECTGLVGAAAAGGALLAVLGGVMGWGAKSDRWVPVPLEQLSFLTQPNGRFGLSFSIPTRR